MIAELPIEQRVLILATSGRDALLAAGVLERDGIQSVICRDLGEFCAAIAEGAAAGIATEELLAPTARETIEMVLDQQPVWSDFPLLILATRPPTPLGRNRLAAAVAPLGNATLLDRPLYPEAMISAVRSAVRARARQFEARELLRRLEESVRQRDTFLATLSHELRNPLGAIHNATQLLAQDVPEAGRPLGVLERQTKHLVRLVDDLLDVSRVTAGKVILKREVVDLRTVLARVARQLEPMMEAQGLQFLPSFGSCPLPVDGDAVRLEQIFSNLLTNALKYTPCGGQVTLTAEPDEGVVRVRVVDTGIGIAREMLPDLFRMFAQADQSLDRSQGGMGIGLTLVRSLLELHGGTVTASSAGLGEGAEFIVTLPLADVLSLAPESASPRSVERRPRHILLVEDNPDNRESLRELLESKGHRVDVASNGPEAIARATSIRPEIAIVDIGLPGMDGFEVARRVRAALGPDILLVALTGYGQPEDRRKSAEAGFDAHVIKPAGLAELDAILSH